WPFRSVLHVALASRAALRPRHGPLRSRAAQAPECCPRPLPFLQTYFAWLAPVRGPSGPPRDCPPLSSLQPGETGHMPDLAVSRPAERLAFARRWLSVRLGDRRGRKGLLLDYSERDQFPICLRFPGASPGTVRAVSAIPRAVPEREAKSPNSSLPGRFPVFHQFRG